MNGHERALLAIKKEPAECAQKELSPGLFWDAQKEVSVSRQREFECVFGCFDPPNLFGL